MSSFLTVREAAKLTGKSPSSIRRVIYPIIGDDQHPDRTHVAPSVEDAKRLRTQGDNFAWKMSEELLRREIPLESVRPSEQKASRESSDGNSELLAMLRRELDVKNHQITQQSEMLSKQIALIGGLSERLHEGHILIGSLQQQLALPDGNTRKKSDVFEAKASKSVPAEKEREAAKKKSMPKKSLFSRFFT